MTYPRRNHFQAKVAPIVTGPDPRQNHPAGVYVIDADWGTKIGMTGGESPEVRLAGLEKAVGFPFVLVGWFGFDTATEARRVEGLAHWLLAEDRTRGEWFHTHPLVALDAVRRAARAETHEEYRAWRRGQ